MFRETSRARTGMGEARAHRGGASAGGALAVGDRPGGRELGRQGDGAGAHPSRFGVVPPRPNPSRRFRSGLSGRASSRCRRSTKTLLDRVESADASALATTRDGHPRHARAAPAHQAHGGLRHRRRRGGRRWISGRRRARERDGGHRRRRAGRPRRGISFSGVHHPALRREPSRRELARVRRRAIRGRHSRGARPSPASPPNPHRPSPSTRENPFKYIPTNRARVDRSRPAR